MQKIDFKKDFKHLYLPSAKEPAVVEVPALNYLMIDGQGDPNTAQSYKDALEALFSVSYSAKFMVKKGGQAVDYGVMPLEGLWWSDDNAAFSVENKAAWKWTAMIMQPAIVSAEAIEAAIADVGKKKKCAALGLLRLESFSEGPAVQILHVGPFSAEGPAVERLHRFITDKGYKASGKHHEIYLSDIRKAAPDKWKTVIRQPVAYE